MPSRARGGRAGRGHGHGQGRGRGGQFEYQDRAPKQQERIYPRQSPVSAYRHFTLGEEARNTERHHGWNDSDLRLRHAHVAFISTGTSSAGELTKAPQQLESTNSGTAATILPSVSSKIVGAASVNDSAAKEMSKMTLNDSIPHTSPTVIKASAASSKSTVNLYEEGNDNDTNTNGVFFTDLNGSTTLIHTGFLAPVIRRSPSPALSDTSEEIIIFSGRQTLCNQNDVSPSTIRYGQASELPRSRDPTKAQTSAGLVLDDPVLNNVRCNESISKPPLGEDVSSINAKQIRSQLGWSTGKPTIKRASTRKQRKKPQGRSKGSQKAIEEAKSLADYIQNTNGGIPASELTLSSGVNERDLGASDMDDWLDDELSSTGNEGINKAIIGARDWDCADLQDLDELSTSSETLDEVSDVLMKRKRPSGVQYLVVSEGLARNDARWLPVSALCKPIAAKLVGVFEEDQAKFERLFSDSDDSDVPSIKDEQLAQDLQDQLDHMEDKLDLEERRMARMTDKEIARLLSKQEELGLGSSNFVLFDGANMDIDEETDLKLNNILSSNMAQKDTPRIKRRNRGQSSFPSAMALADELDRDPYNGFDVIDHDRLSLSKRQKGGRRNLPFEVSDTELEHSMLKTWDNDRAKKKLRKQEREELRAQGLLGKKGKLDMKAKYVEGMTTEEVKREIRNFLSSTLESLPLPPMAHAERKMVHEIASAFNLKSRSVGGGKSRYPTLYKTSRTTAYDEAALLALDPFLFSKRFLPRMDKCKRKGAPLGKARGGGLAMAGVSYKDGEIVGATAPELGLENRGRAMLEKMGWSTGSTLGAINNDRGIVQPVAQVVKTTKAGLG